MAGSRKKSKSKNARIDRVYEAYFEQTKFEGIIYSLLQNNITNLPKLFKIPLDSVLFFIKQRNLKNDLDARVEEIHAQDIEAQAAKGKK